MKVDLELADRIAVQAATIDAATHSLLTDVRAWDESGGWHHQGARSCANWLSWRVGWTGTTAREHVRVARKLGTLPRIDDALRRGELSYCKVRAITRVATPENEETLLIDAGLTTGAQLEQICRRYGAARRNSERTDERDDRERRYVRRIDREDGMVRIEANLRPEEAALVWALEATAKSLIAKPVHASAEAPVEVESAHTSAEACGAARDISNVQAAAEIPDASADADADAVDDYQPYPEAPPDHDADFDPTAMVDGSAQMFGPAAVAKRDPKIFDRADALVALAEQVLRGDRPNRSPIELVITARQEALSKHRSDDEFGLVADGTCVSAETVRRLACDAGIVEVVVDERGNALDVGRRTRSVSAALKRALELRDPTCRFPGCENRLFLDAHHTVHWADGGDTSLNNLLMLCSHHHRFLHE